MSCLPPEIYYIISNFINDFNSFNALLLCSQNSLIGCSKYGNELVNKHENKIGIYKKYRYNGPLFYITYPDFCLLPSYNNEYIHIRYDGMQTKKDRYKLMKRDNKIRIADNYLNHCFNQFGVAKLIKKLKKYMLKTVI